MTGELPQDWTGTPNLERLYLNNNGLTGGIPESIGSLENLVVLNLAFNSLTGEIGPSFGSDLHYEERFGTGSAGGQIMGNTLDIAVGSANIRRGDQ